MTKIHNQKILHNNAIVMISLWIWNSDHSDAFCVHLHPLHLHFPISILLCKTWKSKKYFKLRYQMHLNEYFSHNSFSGNEQIYAILIRDQLCNRNLWLGCCDNRRSGSKVEMKNICNIKAIKILKALNVWSQLCILWRCDGKKSNHLWLQEKLSVLLLRKSKEKLH